MILSGVTIVKSAHDRALLHNEPLLGTGGSKRVCLTLPLLKLEFDELMWKWCGCADYHISMRKRLPTWQPACR